MTEQYILIRVEDAEELEGMLRRLADIVASAGSLSLPESNASASSIARNRPTAVSVNGAPKKRYSIGRGSTGYGYVDVVEEVLNKVEFSLDEAWSRIRPVIDTEGKRPRDSLRTALDRADEYERFKKGDDIWYRRSKGEEEEGMLELN